MSSRRKRSAKERARLFGLHGGVCHLCGEKIDGTRERWELEHVVPWALTRDDSDDNCRPAHARCHRMKTPGDQAGIAKAERTRLKHVGAKRSAQPMAGSRASGWRCRMDGTVERRGAG